MKACSKCLSVKALSEFYARPRMADGLTSECRDCRRSAARARRAASPGAGAEYDRARSRTPERRAARREHAAAHRRAHPERARAREELNRAVRAGAIVRLPCEVCGTPESEAHHPSYAEPLTVKWLCPNHHRAIGHGRTPTEMTT